MKYFVIAIIVVCAPLAVARAEQLVGLTLTNELVRFKSASPGSSATTAISGLLAGDQLVGIDVRPANNLLYGVATDSGIGGAGSGIGRVYSIDPFTGVAALAATLVADITAATPFTAVSGQFFGVDFNPVVDRLRVVSDTGQNLRIDIVTGVTLLDTPLAYAGSDDNSGTPPMVVASAYTNSSAGAGSTTLFGLDAALSTLDTQTPANDGTLNTVAIASLSVFADSAFDISGLTGTGYVVLDGLTLGTIDFTTGDVTEVGLIDTIGSINGLAVLIPEPHTLFLAMIACGVLFGRRGQSRHLASASV